MSISITSINLLRNEKRADIGAAFAGKRLSLTQSRIKVIIFI